MGNAKNNSLLIFLLLTAAAVFGNYQSPTSTSPLPAWPNPSLSSYQSPAPDPGPTLLLVYDESQTLDLIALQSEENAPIRLFEAVSCEASAENIFGGEKSGGWSQNRVRWDLGSIPQDAITTGFVGVREIEFRDHTRYYDPELGRFTQPDPMGYADSMNLYQAFNQSPQNFGDPMGLFTDAEMRQAFRIKKQQGLESAKWWVRKNVTEEADRLRLALEWSNFDPDKIYGGTSGWDVAADVVDELMYQSATPYLLFGKGVLEDKPQYVAASAGMMAGEALLGYGVGELLDWAPGAITRWLSRKSQVARPAPVPQPLGADALRAAEGAERTIETVMRHRAGNRQVIANGQRWHLPTGANENAVPMADALGDLLQESATRWAGQWSRGYLTAAEESAILKAQAAGKPWVARLLEREARGRFVEAQIRAEFPGLKWSPTGVDIVGPGGINYEILSGTISNINRHAKRMADKIFRMITF